MGLSGVPSRLGVVRSSSLGELSIGDEGAVRTRQYGGFDDGSCSS